MSKLNDISCEYFAFGSSPLDSVVGAGPLYGRPYGGVAILIKKKFVPFTVNVFTADRLIAIKIADWLLINAYMPCSGTDSRQLLYDDLLSELHALILSHDDCRVMIGGDFNVNLDCRTSLSDVINDFLRNNGLIRCDTIFPVADQYTYVNESLNDKSCIDYFVTSDPSNTIAFNILDLEVNFSDHRPIMAVVSCNLPNNTTGCKFKAYSDPCVVNLRWDHAKLDLYYQHTRTLLQPVLDDLISHDNRYLDEGPVTEQLDRWYEEVTNALQISAELFIPKRKRNFFKFWWNAELDELKEKAIKSCRAWREAGKPRCGPLNDNYRKDKLLYKKRLNEERGRETSVFTNDLHEALLRKSGTDFWKIWKSKFGGNTNRVIQVNGTSNCAEIANIFAKSFEKTCAPFSAVRNEELKAVYEGNRTTYNEPLRDAGPIFTVELLNRLLDKMKNGKAAGLDNITCEHLKYSHPILITILCKLFNMFVINGYVPTNFGKSYTVPIPKGNVSQQALTAENFRGISISPTISKLFEHAVLVRFSRYFVTSECQFGFKNSLAVGMPFIV